MQEGLPADADGWLIMTRAAADGGRWFPQGEHKAGGEAHTESFLENAGVIITRRRVAVIGVLICP